MNSEQLVKQALTSPIYRLLRETPLTEAPKLSSALGRTLLLKREDRHPIFSFKVRGACNKMLRTPESARKRGVVAASAGNHAQGVAYSARAEGVPAQIFMPVNTPSIKVDSVRRLGAGVSLVGSDFLEALASAKAHAKKHRKVLFHPFDDFDVIAGQATMGVELVREMPEDVEAVFVACGGGGLLAGTAAVIKQLRPKVKVFGVEPEDAASMAAALDAGRPVTLPYVGTFAETVAVARVGNKTFGLCKDSVDGVIVVDIGSICNAIKDIYEDTRTIVEPAGALAVAGARVHAARRKSGRRPLVAVVCGANMNFDSLRYVIERTASGQGGEMLLAATIPERPGSFLGLCRSLGNRHVTEFNYRISRGREAHVFVGIELKGGDDRGQIIRKLKDGGIEAYDLTGDETAELHVRHMVGGRASVNEGEQVYRIEFPERPGSLVRFLNGLERAWNISLFHYRFHGADVGRVLIGFQVPPSARARLERAFSKIGYPFWRVEDNAAYDMFLAEGEAVSRSGPPS